MANCFYNHGKVGLLDGSILLLSQTIKYMLIKSSYTELTTHDHVSDVSGSRVTGTTDFTCANKAVTEDDANNRAYFDNTVDALFSAVAVGDTAGGGILYKDTSTPASDPIIIFHDVTHTPTNGGDITIQFATPANGGLFYI